MSDLKTALLTAPDSQSRWRPGETMVTARHPSEPELQRLPPRTELGREIRKAFVPEPVHVEVDYASLELRLVAELMEASRGDD